MCGIIVINRGETEINTPREFEDHFGFEPPAEEGYSYVDPDCCLCQVDVSKAFNENDIPYKTSAGDFYVGELDKVVDDEEY